MRIGWCYLDKRDATVRALKDYDSMKFIIEHTDEKVKTIHDQMTSIGSPGFEEHIRADNPKAGEDKLIKLIDEIDTLKERYRQAVEFMDWFEPAWKQLSEDEQYILEASYLDDVLVEDICEHFHIVRKTFYPKKLRALDHLTKLLYGIV